MLSGVEAIHVATVLEDCVDQLAILGRIMPCTFEEQPEADDVSYIEMYAIADICNNLDASSKKFLSFTTTE